MSAALSQEEVKRRLIQLRNLEQLHATQGRRVLLLEEQVRLLKEENIALKAQNILLTNTVSDLKLQIEELRTIVFGKKHTREDSDHDDVPPVFPKQPLQRTKQSYRRKRPSEAEVTETLDHPIDACTRCHGSFSERDHVTYFEEDIPMPQQKIVIKHAIAKGYCTPCNRWSAGAPLPVASVLLGQNVQRYVVYCSVICRQSYAQIQDLLQHTYDFDISEGEIAKIMAREGIRLAPEYERLKARIRAAPSIHLDETGWNLLLGDGYRRYAWTMVGGRSHEAVFTLGKTRGKGNATDLIGDSRAVVVSDDYGAYRTLHNPHQLCLAHILRKLRDLAQSGEIRDAHHVHAVTTYQQFAVLYADIETARTSPRPQSAYDALLSRLNMFAHVHSRDPLKMTRIKNQLALRSKSYLTCLLHPGVASDNNAAERSLRHLVLKRKISFGSLTEKTADTLAVLLSVLLSYKTRGMLRGYLAGV